MTDWPPENPIEAALVDIVDASPRGEWMTSNERLREGRRIVLELRERGFEIIRPHPPKPTRTR